MLRAIMLAGATSLVMFAPAHGQVTLDVSKITCSQFSLMKVADPDRIAVWLSGFYNAKRNNMILDVQGLKDNTKKLLDYCALHPDTTLLTAVEPALSGSVRP
jgi:HdeA/HdeB family